MAANHTEPQRTVSNGLVLDSIVTLILTELRRFFREAYCANPGAQRMKALIAARMHPCTCSVMLRIKGTMLILSYVDAGAYTYMSHREYDLCMEDALSEAAYDIALVWTNLVCTRCTTASCSHRR